MSFVVRAAQQNEYEEILDVTGAAFGRDPQHWATIWEHDLNDRPEVHRVGVLDGRIVAAVRIADRKMRVGCAVVNLGGIADVATHPDYRGRGYSTACLEDSIRFMEGNDYDLSMLFTGIQPFYQRLGWEVFPTYDITYVGLKSPKLQRQGINITTFSPDAHLAAVSSVYSKYNENLSGPICREAPQYRGTLWRHYDPDAFFVALKDEQVVGYVRGAFGETAYIYEYGSTTSEEPIDDALEVLLSHFLGKAIERGAMRLHYAPSWPDEEFWFTFKPFKQKILSERRGMMLRVVDWNRFFLRLLPELRERMSFRAKDRAVHVAVRVGEMAIGVHWDGSDAKLTDGEGAEHVLVCSPILVFGLLLGLAVYPNEPRSVDLRPYPQGLDSIAEVGAFTWWPTDNF